MSQKTQIEVIDAFSGAVAALAEHAPPEVVARLHEATGDLIESLNSSATNLAAHEVLRMIHQMIAIQVGLEKGDDRLTRLEQRTERRAHPREEQL